MCVCLCVWADGGLCFEFDFFFFFDECQIKCLQKVYMREGPRFSAAFPALLPQISAAAAAVTFGSNFEVRPQRLSRD